MTTTPSGDVHATDSILVVAPAWVGDMVLAQSLFKTLLIESPRTAIDVLAPAWSRPLLQRMPEVRRIIDAPFEHGRLHWRARRTLGRALRSERYTRAVILPNSWKSALVPFFAGIPRRTGYRGEMRFGLINEMRDLDATTLPTTVQRFVALAGNSAAAPVDIAHIPAPRLSFDPGHVDATLDALGLERPEAPLLVLCPGAAYGPAKRWPAEYFGAVARGRHEQGWRIWLVGAAEDAAVCSAVNEHSGGCCVDLAGRSTLDQAVDLLSLAQLVISNDSGLMHVAAAVDRPLVALFGSSSPRHTPPMGTHTRALWLELSGSPCFKRECPLGHFNCMRQLPAAIVDRAMQELLPS